MEMIHRTLPNVLQKSVRSLRINPCIHRRQCLFQQCEKLSISVRYITGRNAIVDRVLNQTLPSVNWLQHRCMAGHSKFSNIKHRKAAQDSKKSSLMSTYVRLAREAVKTGGSTDPKMNPKLAQVIENAKKSSLSPDTIKRLLERMKAKQMQEILLEILVPGNAIFLIVVEAVNVEQARTDVRAAIKKLPVKLSVNPVSLHFFKHQGFVYVTPDPSQPDLEEVAIECDAEEVVMETNEEGQEVAKFICDPAILAEVKTRLEGMGLTVESHYDNFDALIFATPSEEDQKLIDTVTEKLEGIDTLVRMHTNLNLPESN